jgi:ABC-type multidrug transport system fused ATPase/permease subunit
MELNLINKPSYRVETIEIKRGDAIDQIKFTYNDGQEWSAGHDGGKTDKRKVIFTDGEFLVRVTQEKFENYKCAGAAVEFETNKGRVFAYQPERMCTNRKEEQTTIVAGPGHEIVALQIFKGILIGSVQQVVPEDEQHKQPEAWLVIARHFLKEDGQAKPNFEQFNSSSTAKAAWRKSLAEVKAKKGRSAVLIDCIQMGKLNQAGSAEGVQMCINEAIAKGYCTVKREEEVSMMETLAMLFKLLGSKQNRGKGEKHASESSSSYFSKDFFTFFAVVFLLAASSYFDLYASLMTGQVLGLFSAGSLATGNSGTTIHGDYDATIVNGNTTDAHQHPSGSTNLADHDYLVRGICYYGMDDRCCSSSSVSDGSESMYSLQKAMLLGFVIVKIVQMSTYVANVYLHHNMCDSKNHQLRMDAFDHVLSLDQAFFDTHSMSEIRAGMNVHSLNNLISWNIPYLCTRCLKLVLVVYFMASINATLTFTACLGMLLVKYGVLSPMEGYEKNVHRVQRKLDCMNNQIVDEAFEMITSIKMFSKEERHATEHAQSQQRYMRNINEVVLLRCVREFCYGTLKVATFCTVLYQGLYMIRDAGLGAGKLTSFFLLFQQFQDIFGSIKWHYELLVREFPDIDRFLALMQATSSVRDGTDVLPGYRPVATCAVEADAGASDSTPAAELSATASTGGSGEIGFHGVHFEYPSRPGEKVLKGMTLTLQPNRMTAVVGDSGAGKSTITKLLMRLYDPSHGTVTLDGVDIATLQLRHLHEQIAIVPQNPDLFNCSIGDNIAYGASTRPTTEEIHAAAKLANCYDFVTKFRGGFDTLAGARGAQLSAGQKQRIAIARAAVRKPRILILDEATSSLDVENERTVQEALDRLMKGRTTIIIAHRLCTIKNADEIVCMQDGQVVEKGSHSQLMKKGKGGVYFNLISKQLESADEMEGAMGCELVPDPPTLTRGASGSM